MKRLYFSHEGQEPDVQCLELCTYKDRPSQDTKIGSVNCQQCPACYGWDAEEFWVKCINYAREKEGLSEDPKY